MTDHLQHFSLNHGEYRGTIVRLEHSYQHILKLHDYPQPIAQLLGEALAAVCLLGYPMKQPGKLALQLQSDSPISLLLVEITHTGGIRGLVQWPSQSHPKAPLLLEDGQIGITLAPQKGNRHQGIATIVNGTLAESLSHYYGQSEQIYTRFVLIADAHQAIGLFVQKMPDFHDQDFALSIAEMDLLLRTIRPHELLNDTAIEFFRKLFHQHDVTVFDQHALQFQCQCTHDKMTDAVRLLGLEDAQDLLKTHKNITVTCEFCNDHYSFDANDVAVIFNTVH